MKKYIVGLTDEERRELSELTRKGECKARKLKRALVLLASDEGKLDREIAGGVRVHEVTIERIRKRFVEEGLEAALSERPRPGKAPKLDGHGEATIERIRKRFVEEGLEAALSERPRPGKAPKLDGHGEATLVALACSDPPGGRAKWTM